MDPNHHDAAATGRPDAPPLKVEDPPTLSDYPELRPVLSRAVDAVVASCYPENIDTDLRTYLDRVTAAATVAVYAPIAASAAQMERRTEDSRAAHAAAVVRAAAEMAAHVTQTAAALLSQEDASAATLAPAAPVASDAATAAARGRADAAALITQAATDAAAKVEAAAHTAADAAEREAFDAAAALQAVALDTCYQYALSFAAAAVEAVLSDGRPD